jgi:hypothetical protein
MQRPVKILALGLFLLAGCAPGTAYQKDSSEGFCFKAEDLRHSRCYAEYETCTRRESSASNHTKIQSECQRSGYGILNTERVAHSAPAE